MFITFSDGQRIEGVIYSHSGNTLRVALKGGDDLVDFRLISGQWVSENCEPVEIEFAWRRSPANEVVTEADCICSAELASRLVQSLWIGCPGDEGKILAAGTQAG